jgi:hypothetical protein
MTIHGLHYLSAFNRLYKKGISIEMPFFLKLLSRKLGTFGYLSNEKKTLLQYSFIYKQIDQVPNNVEHIESIRN